MTGMDSTTDRSAPALQGRVALVERLGGSSHLHFDVGPHRLLAVVTEEAVPAIGDPIDVQVPPLKVHLFARDGRRMGAD